MSSVTSTVGINPKPAIYDQRVLVIGATGLVGYHFVKKIHESIHTKEIIVVCRRETNLFKDLQKVVLKAESNTDKWEDLIAQGPKLDLVFSALGTKKGETPIQNKSQDPLKLVDLDLNLKLAQAAKANGAKVYGLVTSFNNSFISSLFPYFKLKQQVEEAIISLGFERTLLFRPGPLIGDRKQIGQVDLSINTLLSSIIAQLTYKTAVSFLVGTSIKAEEVAESAAYLMEVGTVGSDSVKVVSSSELLDLSRCLKSI